MRYTVHFASFTKSKSVPHCAATADTRSAITLPPQFEPRVAGVNDPGYSLRSSQGCYSVENILKAPCKFSVEG